MIYGIILSIIFVAVIYYHIKSSAKADLIMKEKIRLREEELKREEEKLQANKELKLNLLNNLVTTNNKVHILDKFKEPTEDYYALIDVEGLHSNPVYKDLPCSFKLKIFDRAIHLNIYKNNSTEPLKDNLTEIVYFKVFVKSQDLVIESKMYLTNTDIIFDSEVHLFIAEQYSKGFNNFKFSISLEKNETVTYFFEINL